MRGLDQRALSGPCQNVRPPEPAIRRGQTPTTMLDALPARPRSRAAPAIHGATIQPTIYSGTNP
jgi:hypothetical protein